MRAITIATLGVLAVLVVWPAQAEESTAGQDRWRRAIDVTQWRASGAGAVLDLPRKVRADLTLNVGLQKHLERTLARHPTQAASVVALDPTDGRVLALVGGETAFDASAPAASVFKVITASALVDRGYHAKSRACYGGGSRGLSARDLVDDKKRDRWCATLADAMGLSINTVFAKFADRSLDRATVKQYVDAFAFSQRLPYDIDTTPSAADVPGQRLERARMSAGFWHSYMSPMHGALIAATIANDGAMPRAALLERVTDRSGATLHRRRASTFRQVIPAATANSVANMMTKTISQGTARRAFHDKTGRPFVPGVKIAAKTGSLSRSNPYRGYTWWVGFAPVDNPQIAVAALVVNGPKWHIKASYLARQAMAYHFNKR